MYRHVYATVNLDILENNAREIKKLSGHEYMYAVVKANGYGHGAINASRAFIEGGATHLAVATLQEAIDLRKEFADIPILVMGYINEEFFEIAAKFAITITITNYDQLLFLKEYKDKLLKVHIKVDSGMNRLGFKDLDIIKEIYSSLKYNEYVEVEGIFTHFASSPSLDTRAYKKQYKLFKSIVTEMEGLFKYVHCQNSGAIVYPIGDFSFCNIARPGIVLYGFNPSTEQDTDVDVKQAISIFAQVSNVKKIKKNEAVGYDGTFKADKETNIATLPLGYADGVLRGNTRRNVYINDKPYPIVGIVCMDQLMVEVDEDIKVGDVVEIIGENATVESVAKHLGTITYEVACTISSRIPRVYVENNDVKEVISFQNIDKN